MEANFPDSEVYSCLHPFGILSEKKKREKKENNCRSCTKNTFTVMQVKLLLETASLFHYVKTEEGTPFKE